MHLPKLFRPKRENVRLKFDCSYSRLIHDLQSEKSDIAGRQISRLPTESHESSRKIVQHSELYIHVFPWSTNKSWRDEWWSSKRIMIISQKLCEQTDVCQLVFSGIFINFPRTQLHTTIPGMVKFLRLECLSNQTKGNIAQYVENSKPRKNSNG